MSTDVYSNPPITALSLDLLSASAEFVSGNLIARRHRKLITPTDSTHDPPYSDRVHMILWDLYYRRFSRIMVFLIYLSRLEHSYILVTRYLSHGTHST